MKHTNTTSHHYFLLTKQMCTAKRLIVSLKLKEIVTYLNPLLECGLNAPLLIEFQESQLLTASRQHVLEI